MKLTLQNTNYNKMTTFIIILILVQYILLYTTIFFLLKTGDNKRKKLPLYLHILMFFLINIPFLGLGCWIFIIQGIIEYGEGDDIYIRLPKKILDFFKKEI